MENFAVSLLRRQPFLIDDHQAKFPVPGSLIAVVSGKPGAASTMPNAFNFTESPFDCLSHDEQRLVRNNVDIAYFRPGETILDVGVQPTHLFVIIKGVVHQIEGGEVINTYGADDCFDGRGLVAEKVSDRIRTKAASTRPCSPASPRPTTKRCTCRSWAYCRQKAGNKNASQGRRSSRIAGSCCI